MRRALGVAGEDERTESKITQIQTRLLFCLRMVLSALRSLLLVLPRTRG